MPLIFALGLVDAPTPQTRISTAQRRIDLLAIEQNAWFWHSDAAS
jgi:dihydroneopterin aldolase